MAVAYFTEFTQTDPQVAEKVTTRIQEQVGRTGPAGGTYHAEGALDDGGWWTFNVWESEEAADAFWREILSPALQSFDVPQPQRRKLAVLFDTSGPPPAQ